MKYQLENIQVIDDGGREALQSVVTIGEIAQLIESKGVLIGNPRPDHDVLGRTRSGALRYRKTAQRVKDWADDLLRNRALLGNLTWNLQAGTEYEVDGVERRLLIDGPGFATDIDSASRMRAIALAAKAMPSTMDPATRVSVRIVPVCKGDETDKLFWTYNQIGEKVSNTVAKATYQGTSLQKLASRLMMESPHLGLDNVETKFDTVSKNSPKLVAFGTLSGAVEANWTGDPFDEHEMSTQIEFLKSYWDALVLVRPELGLLPLSKRQQARKDSLSASALAIHGYIGVANQLHERGVSDFGVLDGLAHMKTLTATGLRHEVGESVDWFDYDNPEWLKRGVLVQATSTDGTPRLTSRMSFQTRSAMIHAMLERLGLR